MDIHKLSSMDAVAYASARGLALVALCLAGPTFGCSDDGGNASSSDTDATDSDASSTSSETTGDESSSDSQSGDGDGDSGDGDGDDPATATDSGDGDGDSGDGDGDSGDGDGDSGDGDGDSGDGDGEPPEEFCGDGIVNGDEECDEGDANANDAACTEACLNAVCGDGLVQANVEDCDDGNDDETDSCTSLCSSPSCDDGLLSGDESAVDCGGSCEGCTPGEACFDAEDCGPGLLCEDTCRIAFSCLELRQSGVDTDGVYTIDPDGVGGADPFEAYCDMTTDGGGWTLLMKGTGDCTFPYDNEAWTTNNVVNANDLSLDLTTAKYPAFNTVELTELWANWPELDHAMNASWDMEMTALDRFQTFEDLGDVGAQFFGGWPQQFGYQEYGFNLTCQPAASARWGWMWNNENSCTSNDATAGIGLRCSGGNRNVDFGGSASCCSSLPNGNYPAAAHIYGR